MFFFPPHFSWSYLLSKEEIEEIKHSISLEGPVEFSSLQSNLGCIVGVNMADYDLLLEMMTVVELSSTMELLWLIIELGIFKSHSNPSTTYLWLLKPWVNLLTLFTPGAPWLSLRFNPSWDVQQKYFYCVHTHKYDSKGMHAFFVLAFL